MKAEFIGRDGSMGFRNGRVYQIRTNVITNSRGQSFLWVYDVSSNLYCPYSRLETMLDNWKLLDKGVLSMKFKVGDRVRVKEFENDASMGYGIGNEYTIDGVDGGSQFPYALAGCYFKEYELELVVKGNEDMNIEIK